MNIYDIRNTEIKELVELCELHAEFEGSDYDRTDKVNKLRSDIINSNIIKCLVLVSDDSSKLYGYCTYIKQYSTWDASWYNYMDCLYLREEVRGMGWGTKFIDVIKKDGLPIQWQTPISNLRAIEFYNKIGAVSTTKERYKLILE